MTERALYVAKSGLEVQRTRMAAISNNLANVNTIGYKKTRLLVEDLPYQNIRQVGAQSTQSTQLPTGLQLGTGVRSVGTEKQHTQGGMQQTNNSLDVAINGRGFFQVLMSNGDINYTRNGAFQLDLNGQMVTASGRAVQPTITIPQDAISITIGRDGTVSALQPGSTTPTQLGQLQLATFVNPTGLEPIGENLFRESVSSGAPIIGTPGSQGNGALFQNSLESSNVNVVEELVNMIETQRSYEMNSKAISKVDRMLAFINQQL